MPGIVNPHKKGRQGREARGDSGEFCDLESQLRAAALGNVGARGLQCPALTELDPQASPPPPTHLQLVAGLRQNSPLVSHNW